ncbi:phosphoadenylyl-sulfate reductase [Rhodovastum atsumiense]|uniref:Adenosine 5'-phosphosulfate reductase n=1 Tax=Rhodovastum atsumiense TaxID=504468 RepID=A0A5M6IML3_9PROT|nr:phosphoadenylyl-sulfate reductase [Rhodovastum atsumiense]
MTAADPAALASLWTDLDPAMRLASLRRALPGRLVLTTSFGAEDQVLTHLIATTGLQVTLVTLDTGRLFAQTYEVWAETERRYGLRVQAVCPDAGALEDLVAAQGINGFYDSPAARHACCGVRKLAPLRRALHGAAGWITGLRADQSGHRSELPFLERDPVHGLLKANPLRDWTRARVDEFLAHHAVPVNKLHAQGYASIGCAPCTRAIAPGEPERAGRWWWEQDSARECGLHVGPDGRLARTRRESVA